MEILINKIATEKSMEFSQKIYNGIMWFGSPTTSQKIWKSVSNSYLYSCVYYVIIYNNQEVEPSTHVRIKTHDGKWKKLEDILLSEIDTTNT